jgi:hypothetical protein
MIGNHSVGSLPWILLAFFATALTTYTRIEQPGAASKVSDAKQVRPKLRTCDVPTQANIRPTDFDHLHMLAASCRSDKSLLQAPF